MKNTNNKFLQHSGVAVPLICGPMYPCSNPELVAAASSAGALGVIQPISLTYVHGYEFSSGIDYIQKLTDRPIAMNMLIEKSSRHYREKMQQYLDIALKKGVRFYITSLGKPDWVTEQVHEYNGYVYHDVTNAKWADKAMSCNVDGLIAVNNRAGGHAGLLNYQELYDELQSYGLPVVCAGGISSKSSYQAALDYGYQAVQMGTRFIASHECTASDAYKQAIIHSHESDIVLSERITGVPVSVINTAEVQRRGLKPSYLEALMLKHRKLKHFMRTILALKSLYQLKHSLKGDSLNNDYWQAGKSVQHIDSVLSVKEIVEQITA